MAKKETLTNKRIEEDIISSMKQGVEMTEDEYRRWDIPCFVIAGILLILTFFYPLESMLSILAGLGALIVAAIFFAIRFRRKVKQVSIEDYEIKTATLSHTLEEEYEQQAGRHRTRHVHIRVLCFEGGGRWQIPEKNYSWSIERPMSAWYVFDNAHRGDVFYIVVEKATGNIPVAYDTEFFIYESTKQ